MNQATKQRHYIPEWATQKNVRQARLAEGTGVDKATVSKWFNDRRMPLDQTLDRIAEIFGIERADLFRHPDSVALRSNAGDNGNLPVGLRPFAYTSEWRRVPVRGRAGDKAETLTPLALREDAEEMVDCPGHLLAVNTLYALHVDTDELDPMIPSGETVLVHPGRGLVIGHPCVVITPENKALLRIYRGRVPEGHATNTLKHEQIVIYPDQPGLEVHKVLTYGELIGA